MLLIELINPCNGWRHNDSKPLWCLIFITRQLSPEWRYCTVLIYFKCFSLVKHFEIFSGARKKEFTHFGVHWVSGSLEKMLSFSSFFNPHYIRLLNYFLDKQWVSWLTCGQNNALLENLLSMLIFNQLAYALGLPSLQRAHTDRVQNMNKTCNEKVEVTWTGNNCQQCQ